MGITIDSWEGGTDINQMESLVASTSGTKLLDYFVGMGFSANFVAEAIREHGEENSNVILEVLLNRPAEPSNDIASCSSSADANLINHFVGMGFKKKTVNRVIQEQAECKNLDSILETLLTYSAIEKTQQPSTTDEKPSLEDDQYQSENEENIYWEYDSDDFTTGALSEFESEDESDPLVCLAKMGYDKDEVAMAIERCGPEASVVELADFIFAAQLSKAHDQMYPREIPPPTNRDYEKLRKRKFAGSDSPRKKIKIMKMNNDSISFPKPMIGFGLPNFPGGVTQRSIPDEAKGPPFFYYENVAFAPKGVWKTISEHLYGVEPEFVDSKHICAAARKRGYVHNLPIDGRFGVDPLPHLTIQEAIPMTTHWWPKWDRRTKLSCLQTVYASAKTTERIRQAIEKFEGAPPLCIQSYVLEECRKWNLVWVGRNKVAPLEPDEVEMLLGFPKNHTRGGGSNRTDRYKSLGNSFQVDTVAYHLSVLKGLFPNGMNVLSLFSGIGGAEVALHRVGIPLRNVVSVEKSEVNRNIVRSWWIETNQKGNLIDLTDVKELDDGRIRELVRMLGGFDLVVGGSPCNNLAGNNRVSRDGLDGRESSLFFDFDRILRSVRAFMNPQPTHSVGAFFNS